MSGQLNPPEILGEEAPPEEIPDAPEELPPIEEVRYQPPGHFARTPEGDLCWPKTGDRDSPNAGEIVGHYEPPEILGVLLRMDGERGRDPDAVERVTGVRLPAQRLRMPLKMFERMGIFHPGQVTRLGRLGRLLRDATGGNGLKRIVLREAASTLTRYTFDNPVERKLPEGRSVHPYYVILKAAISLNGRLHWDEVNRELMRILDDVDLAQVVERIREARMEPGYNEFIGGPADDAGLLRARCHPAVPNAVGRDPVGQLRDQNMTPLLKRAGFMELLLQRPTRAEQGYWRVPDDADPILQTELADAPPVRRFANAAEWNRWFYEAILPEEVDAAPPDDPVASPVGELTLEDLKESIREFSPDLSYPDTLLASVLAAMRAGDGKNFIILKGISGTGKSKLVQAIARAVYRTRDIREPKLTLVEVQPEWTDSAPLLGSFKIVEHSYAQPKFLKALLSAQATGEPTFVCLDEMNLSRVEHYLAECLSAMESGLPMTLDRRSDESVPADVRWPSSLFLFGTINVDESTLAISDKVLDRARVIDTSAIEMEPKLLEWLAACRHLGEAERARVRELLLSVWTTLRSRGAHFGFRTCRAIVRFVDEAVASSGGVLTVDAALDLELRQRVLTKLRGAGEAWDETLATLEEVLRTLHGSPTSADIVAAMRIDLERLGTFRAWI